VERPREDEAIEDPVPEADALEQAMPLVGDDNEDELPAPLIEELPPDVPEADALEQAQPVEVDEDEFRDV
jgi:hypothetical protein